jgi:hypothetical protein
VALYSPYVAANDAGFVRVASCVVDADASSSMYRFVTGSWFTTTGLGDDGVTDAALDDAGCWADVECVALGFPELPQAASTSAPAANSAALTFIGIPHFT